MNDMNTTSTASHNSAFVGWYDKHRGDARWQALHFGLSQLSVQERARLRMWLDLKKPLALDTFNYDPVRNLWCPLAIGLNVPAKVGRLAATISNEEAKVIIRRVGESHHPGFTLNPMSGLRGAFFRENRLVDLNRMCHFIEATC
jgi:hypothetical protein